MKAHQFYSNECVKVIKRAATNTLDDLNNRSFRSKKKN